MGANGTIDVVIASHAGLDAEVLAEMPAHAFAEELLAAVPVLRQRGIRIGPLKPGDVDVLLLALS